MHEVVITGIGVVGPHGVGMASISESLRHGRCVFARWPASAAPPHDDARIATVGEYSKTRYFSERHLRQMDKAMSISAFAAGVALADAGFEDGAAPGNTATMLGTSRSEQTSIQKFMQPLVQGRPERINPSDFPLVARNIACGQIAIRFGLRGPSSVLSSGSIASIEAITRAAHMIRNGRAEVALAGGMEVLSKFALYMARHLYGDERLAGQPAFLGGQGGALVPSEGACMLVLESAEHAERRNGRVYARISASRAGRLGRDGSGATLHACWKDLTTAVSMAADQVDVIVAGAGGADRPHELAETAALQRWMRDTEATSIVLPRSVAGEGEAWTSALQVACAAQMLAGEPTWAARHLADDVDDLLRQRATGGVAVQRAALVSGIQSQGAYSALLLRPA